MCAGCADPAAKSLGVATSASGAGTARQLGAAAVSGGRAATCVALLDLAALEAVQLERLQVLQLRRICSAVRTMQIILADCEAGERDLGERDLGERKSRSTD